MPLVTTTDELRARYNGCARTGGVSLRNFDEGVVKTLGAKVFYGDSTEPPTAAELDACTDEELERLQPNYFVPDGVIPGVPPPAGYPGIPVTWSNPEEQFEKYKVPLFWIERQDVTPAMNRWHPGLLQYRTSGLGALPVGDEADGNYDRYEQIQQAVPFDITYSLNIESRSGIKTRGRAVAMFMYALKVFPPYCYVALLDSLNDVRTYDAFMESTNPLGEVQDVTERRIGHVMTIRVEAELDLNDAETFAAVTDNPTFNFGQV